MRVKSEELKEFLEALDGVIRDHRELLNDEPRIGRSFGEAYQAAKTKYDDSIASIH